MKAFRLTDFSPRSAELSDLPDPQPAPGSVLVEVAACGVCGSDLHAYRADRGYEWISTPVVLGHEFSGTVKALGEGVERLQVGDRVAAVAIQGCLSCSACLAGDTHLCAARRVIGLSYDGGMAERVTVNAAYLVKIPDGLELPLAALIEPLSVAVHAVLVRARVSPGDRVVVSGPGPIGLLSGFVAKLAGAQVTMLGTRADAQTRLPAAAALGLEATQDAGALAPPDLWVEASGATAAFDAAVRSVRRGGALSVVGMYAQATEFFPTVAVRAELTLSFSYASNHQDYETAARILEGHASELKTLTTPFPLEHAAEAFDQALAGGVVKALLIP